MSNTMKKVETCELCGNEFTRICELESYVGNHCFDCSFWLKKINMSEADEGKRVIVDGQHYRLGNAHSGPSKGFGGRKFTILFQDGKIIETSNLWHQGEIPEKFKVNLPDNAIFVPVETATILNSSEAGIPF